MAAVALVLVGAVVVVALVLSGGTSTNATSPARRAALRDYCHDIGLVQVGVGRVDALARLLPKLHRDVAKFTRAGDAKDAAAVKRIHQAATKLKRGLRTGSGVPAATTQLTNAIGAAPTC